MTSNLEPSSRLRSIHRCNICPTGKLGRHLRAVVAAALIGAFVASGCADPNRRAKMLGGAGAVLAVGGGVVWVAGEKLDSDAMVVPGIIGVVAGVVLVIVAGGLMAFETACDADADCPEGQRCREVPAPAGREPYSQCVPR